MGYDVLDKLELKSDRFEALIESKRNRLKAAQGTLKGS